MGSVWWAERLGCETRVASKLMSLRDHRPRVLRALGVTGAPATAPVNQAVPRHVTAFASARRVDSAPPVASASLHPSGRYRPALTLLCQSRRRLSTAAPRAEVNPTGFRASIKSLMLATPARVSQSPFTDRREGRPPKQSRRTRWLRLATPSQIERHPAVASNHSVQSHSPLHPHAAQ